MQTSLQSFKSSQKVNILDGTTEKKWIYAKMWAVGLWPFKARGNHSVCLQQKGDGICTLKVDC